MVDRRFGLSTNRRAKWTIAIVFSIRVGLVRSKDWNPFQPPNSGKKNVTSETHMATGIFEKLQFNYRSVYHLHETHYQ